MNKTRNILCIGLLGYLTFVGVQIYAHSVDPNWCSPWLKASVCEADRIQRSIQTRVYATPAPEEQVGEY